MYVVSSFDENVDDNDDDDEMTMMTRRAVSCSE